MTFTKTNIQELKPDDWVFEDNHLTKVRFIQLLSKRKYKLTLENNVSYVVDWRTCFNKVDR